MGLRTVEVRNGRLLVNGVAVTIAGVNRHEHDPVNGHVVGVEGMRHDVRLMKELNFNTVRCSHYPVMSAWYALFTACSLHRCAARTTPVMSAGTLSATLSGCT